jgi:hypothetical protein
MDRAASFTLDRGNARKFALAIEEPASNSNLGDFTSGAGRALHNLADEVRRRLALLASAAWMSLSRPPDR